MFINAIRHHLFLFFLDLRHSNLIGKVMRLMARKNHKCPHNKRVSALIVMKQYRRVMEIKQKRFTVTKLIHSLHVFDYIPNTMQHLTLSIITRHIFFLYSLTECILQYCYIKLSVFIHLNR